MCFYIELIVGFFMPRKRVLRNLNEHYKHFNLHVNKFVFQCCAKHNSRII